MTVLDAAILGLVQGLTEFLPVSSSGHLVLFGHLLGIEAAASNVLFDVILHVATLAAVLTVYARDAWRALVAALRASMALPRQGLAVFGIGVADADQDAQQQDAALALFVVLATVPTGLIGVLFKDSFEALFASPRAAAIALFGTALILVSSRFASRLASRSTATRRSPSWRDALIIGVLQGMAIIPGISRSGTTITAALWLRLDAERAARASFLMSVPAILGALVLELRHLGGAGLDPVATLVGAAVAFVSGILAIFVVLRVLRWQGFWFFAPYCVLAGTLGLLFT